MTKKNGACVLISALVMLGLPWFGVRFVSAYSAMLYCMLLFYVVNPICVVRVGYYSGRNLPAAWFQPIVCTGFFAAGAWYFLKMGTTELLVLTAVYFALGCITAGMIWIAFEKKK